MGDEEDSLPGSRLPDADSVPPDSPRPSGAGGSASPPPQKESRRRRLEGVISEIVRRAVELGVEKAQEAPDNLKSFVGDLKVPKDIGHYLLGQIDDTKTGIFRVVAKEIRDFLEHTNVSGEVQKLLTTVQFEVNTTIRFTPNDGREKKRETGDADGIAESAAAVEGEPEQGAGQTPLPRPEVKTSVHVRRGERERPARRDRGT